MKTLYIECNMGAAGDMLMSALLELHPNAEEFLNRLNKLGIPNVTVSKTASVKCGITGTHIDVNVNGEHEDEHMHDHHDHHHDHHHHHHHADEVFTSWGKETPKKYKKEELEEILQKLSKDDSYGMILRSKGILQTEDGSWVQFDLVPGEYEIREGSADYTGRICVIGSKLKEDELEGLFF